MAGSPFRVLLAVLSAVLVALTAGVTAPVVASEGESGRHVVFLSVDGLHQSDLNWYVNHHPNSALASLMKKGVEFTQARTPVPSDSFPGLVGPLTGGNPSSTGIYSCR